MTQAAVPGREGSVAVRRAHVQGDYTSYFHGRGRGSLGWEDWLGGLGIVVWIRQEGRNVLVKLHFLRCSMV